MSESSPALGTIAAVVIYHGITALARLRGYFAAGGDPMGRSQPTPANARTGRPASARALPLAEERGLHVVGVRRLLPLGKVDDDERSPVG